MNASIGRTTRIAGQEGTHAYRRVQCFQGGTYRDLKHPLHLAPRISSLDQL